MKTELYEWDLPRPSRTSDSVEISHRLAYDLYGSAQFWYHLSFYPKKRGSKHGVRHSGPWQELSTLVADIPQVVAFHRAPGEEVEEVWILVQGDLNYKTVSEISDAVADIQLEFEFVTNTHLIRSEDEIPNDSTLVWQRIG